MHWAKDPNGQTIPPERGGVATCIDCQEWVTGKGSDHDFVRDYWSHRAGHDCASQDPWYDRDNKMSDWHIGWQELVTRGQREVRITRDGIWHRADIVAANGQIVEVQNSSIAGRKVRDREQFYGNMIWLWNTIEPFAEERLTIRTQIDQSLPTNFCLFRWANPWKTIGICETPLLFDLGGNLIQVGNIGPEFSGWGYLVPKQQVVEWINDGAPGTPVDPRIALEKRRAAKKEAERQKVLVEKLRLETEARETHQREWEAKRQKWEAERPQREAEFQRQEDERQQREAERMRQDAELRRQQHEAERERMEAFRKRPILDWRSSTHWNNVRKQPCIACGRTTLLLDDAQRPQHKVCAELALVGRNTA